MTWVRDPWFQTVTISTGTGAVVLGTVGGAFGTATGVVIGTTAGALPALFTFGLSLPVGAVVGGGMGLCGGAVAGGSAGAICGAAAGHGGYTYQVHIRIKNGVITVHKRVKASAERGMVTIQEKASGIKATVSKTVDDSVSKAKKTCVRAGPPCSWTGSPKAGSCGPEPRQSVHQCRESTCAHIARVARPSWAKHIFSQRYVRPLV